MKEVLTKGETAVAFLPKPLDFEKLLVYLKKSLNYEWVLRPPDDTWQTVLPSELIPRNRSLPP